MSGLNMSDLNRKAVTARYKELKTVAGIFSLTCVPTQAVWVGRATNLATVLNRIMFELRHGSCRTPGLQAAWRAHGPDAFRFDELERLDDDTLPYQRDGILKERLEHWSAQRAAERIV